MDKNNNFPTLVNAHKQHELRREASVFVQRFKSDIFPILVSLGICDEKHIKKYLRSESTEDIYRDAVEESGENLRFLATAAYLTGKDLWAQIREKGCDVTTPQEDGFVFAKFPCLDMPYRESVLRSVIVKDTDILIDSKRIEEESVVYPTEKQAGLYKLVSDFCDQLEEMGYSRMPVAKLFKYNRKGKLRPFASGVVNSLWSYEKK